MLQPSLVRIWRRCAPLELVVGPSSAAPSFPASCVSASGEVLVGGREAERQLEYLVALRLPGLVESGQLAPLDASLSPPPADGGENDAEVDLDAVHAAASVL